MLFSIKNRLVPTLLLLVLFVVAALVARQALRLPWHLEATPGLVRQLALVMAAIAASDALLHGILWLGLRERYLARYGALVASFRSQGPAEIAAGGLLAGGEELVFRGVLLQGLMSRAGAGPAVAIALSALAFGALHLPRERRLVPFALWAVWEGMLLGGIYVMSGSLLLLMLAHALHDVLGFSLFALQRRTGWLLAPVVDGPGVRQSPRRRAGTRQPPRRRGQRAGAGTHAERGSRCRGGGEGRRAGRENGGKR